MKNFDDWTADDVALLSNEQMHEDMAIMMAQRDVQDPEASGWQLNAVHENYRLYDAEVSKRQRAGDPYWSQAFGIDSELGETLQAIAEKESQAMYTANSHTSHNAYWMAGYKKAMEHQFGISPLG